MMIAPLSFPQMERGTLPTSIMWMGVRFASVVGMLPTDNGVGYRTVRALQGVRDLYHLPHRYT